MPYRRGFVAIIAIAFFCASCGEDLQSGPVSDDGSPPCGRMVVEPLTLDFGDLERGCVNRHVTLSNDGTCPISVTDVFLTGSPNYRITADNDERLPYEPDVPFVLEAGGSLRIELTRCGEPDEAVLLLRADDAAPPSVAVEIDP